MSDNTIMIIDDDADQIQMMENFISSEYRVISADSGQKALDILRSGEKPDLIFLDINMPEMDGYETYNRIKIIGGADIPIVFLTGLSDEFNESRGLECGARDYLKKPVGKYVLLARINRYLSMQKGNENVLDMKRIEKLPEHLTEKEMEVAKLLAKFYSDTEISNMLYISVPYTKKLVAEVKEKLGLKKRGDIREYFIK